MAGRLLVSCLRQDFAQQVRGAHAGLAKIGSREVVGPGYNGDINYCDRTEYPMPAIRFKENSPDIMVLREKEKGDWKKMTIEEKKALYRASFCQTFSEMNAPTGEWKGVFAIALLGAAGAMWIYMFYRQMVYTPLPQSFTEEAQLAQLERMKILRVNPVTNS